MTLIVSVLIVVAAVILSLLFSSLTYSLRELSRPRFIERMASMNRSEWTQMTLDQSSELIFITAIGRLFANLFIFIGIARIFRVSNIESELLRVVLAVIVTSIITLFCSVAIPHALAEHVGEALIAYSAHFLHGLRITLKPITHVMHGVDRLVRNLAGQPDRAAPEQREQREQQIEKEIMSVVQEGQKEGVVDDQEREMIESAIEFSDTTVGQAMTPRPEIIGLPVSAKLEQVKSLFEESGHSRLPVYEGIVDKIVGVLYARDLIDLLGVPGDQFDLRKMMRAPLFVPKTRLLGDLLRDFREQKVHIAIILDEYGGTAGIITIEDVLKQLVGDMGDEHEPSEPSLLKRVDEHAAEADARILVDQLNRLMGLDLPEDAGYETLGGFISTTLGRIPEKGTCFEQHGARYTILDAEPQRVNRVRIEVVAPQPAVGSPTK